MLIFIVFAISSFAANYAIDTAYVNQEKSLEKTIEVQQIIIDDNKSKKPTKQCHHKLK